MLSQNHEEAPWVAHDLAATAVHSSELAAVQSIGFEDPLAILGSAPLPELPWWKRISPTTIFVLLAGALGILFLLHELTIAGRIGFPVDEAWIDQVYARHFFHDIAFEFNAGERTAGPTAPFWVVFLAIGNSVFHDPLLTGKLLGAIFLFLTGYYVFRLLRSTDEDYGTGLLGGVLAVTTSQLAWAELSGLESTLAASLVAGGLWWYFAHSAGWRHHLTGAVFALAALTRPETTIIFLILLLYDFVTLRRDRLDGLGSLHPLREVLLTALAFVLVLAPIALTNVALSGSIIPVTFYAGLTNESFIVLLRHGHVLDCLWRLVAGLRGIWFMIRDVYFSFNPIFLMTIAAAAFVRRSRHLTIRGRAESLFDLSLLVLLIFPYLRAVALGVDDSFGEYLRWTHFLIPVYVVAGLTSIRILLRRYLKRGLTQRSTLYVAAGLVLVLGLTAIFVRGSEAASYLTVRPFVDPMLLVFFTGLLLGIALRYNDLHPWKRVTDDFVTEEERNRMTFHFYDSADEDNVHHLPHRTIDALRTVLLIILAWNLANLPRAANDFGNDVRTERLTKVAMSLSVASFTQPTDVIAATDVGALGWIAERRVIDVRGRLENQVSYDNRMMGPDRALIKTLSDARPQFFAVFDHDYDPLIRKGESSGFFRLVAGSETDGDARLYRIDYGALPSMQ